MTDQANTYLPFGQDTEEQTVTLEGIVSEFRRYLKLFLAVFAILFIAILAVSLSQAPKYTSTAAVLIGDDNKKSLPGQAEANDRPVDQATVESEVELLKSNTIAARVMNDLGLDKDPEFNPALRKGSSVLAGVKNIVTLKFLRNWFARKADTSTPAEWTAKMQRQDVIDAIEDGLSVNRAGLTRVINVGFTAHSKEKAAQIADDWVRQYIAQKMDTAEAANQREAAFLSKRIDGLRGQVEEADRKVQQYKIAHNLLSAQGATLTEQEISDLNRQLATVRVDQAEAQARLSTARSQLRAGSTGDDVGETLNSPVVTSLRTQAAQISSRLADLETRYGPRHPEILKARQQLSDINSQIQAEVNRIISNLDAQNHIQQQRAGALIGTVQHTQGQLAANSRATVELQELQMNADSVRALYESYLDRLKQSVTGSGAQSQNATIVTDASIPTGPSSPKLGLSLVVAFAASMLGAGGAVMARRAFDSGLTTGHEVEERLGVPYLAGVPELSSTQDVHLPKGMKPHRYIIHKRLSAFSEGFRSLRVALFNGPGRKIKVLAITSALPGEGKTTTSVCLATTLAMAGESVIIVDCDLERRSLNTVFDLSPEKGLVEVLEGTAELEDVVVMDEDTRLAILPLSGLLPSNRDLFGTEAVDKLLNTLKAKYDVVILDTAPVLPVADTRILAQKVDAVALMVRWRRTPLKASQRAVELMKGVGVNFRGAALTQINIKEQAKYGYGDTEYFYKAYQSYYA